MNQTTNTTSNDNRRTNERFITSPMHHSISIRNFESDTFTHDGHAYDISEGGVCFELDEPIAPGTKVGVMIHLPAGFDVGPGRAIFANGRVVWLGDLDEPGPIQMGVVFDYFCRKGDQERLQNFLHRGVVRRSAAA